MRRVYLRLYPLAFLFLLTACVGKSTYLQKVDEAARLQEAMARLETEVAQLREEQATLLSRNEGLVQQLAEAQSRAEELRSDLVRARADLDRLEAVLSARSQEAGKAMAEMRRTIDTLHQEIRGRDLEIEGLVAQLEAEQIGRDARLAQVQSTYGELVTKMEAEIERGEITISELQGKLTVNLVERILFDSGQAEVKTAGLEVLQRVGEILREERDKEVVVEGHTDNLPIGPRLRSTFPTNWELSVARAVNVVHVLQGRVGIPGERLSASGFGPFRPIADNSTPEGRAQNRRIQIVLVPVERRVVEGLQ